MECTLCIGAEFTLTSEPSLLRPICLGERVVFTCMGTDVPTGFNWLLNGSTISSFSFVSDPPLSYPLELSLMPPLPGVVMEVISAAINSIEGNSIDIVSTLNVSDVSSLKGLFLHCQGSFGRRSNEIDTEATYLGEA